MNENTASHWACMQAHFSHREQRFQNPSFNPQKNDNLSKTSKKVSEACKSQNTSY